MTTENESVMHFDMNMKKFLNLGSVSRSRIYFELWFHIQVEVQYKQQISRFKIGMWKKFPNYT